MPKKEMTMISLSQVDKFADELTAEDIGNLLGGRAGFACIENTCGSDTGNCQSNECSIYSGNCVENDCAAYSGDCVGHSNA